MREKVNVCIVGAGAGGATVAMLAAEAGLSVVVLDAGPRWDYAKDYVHEPGIMPRKFRWDMPIILEGDPDWVQPQAAIGHNSYGVGGGMNHWGGKAYRLHPSDLTTKTRDGVGLDWPISFQELSAYYDRAESLLGVAGNHNNLGPTCPSRNPFPMQAHRPPYWGSVTASAFKKLGLSTGNCGGWAINSTPYQGRVRCNYCGFCQHGCPIGAKANSLITQIPRAERAGAEIRPRCFAFEIMTDSLGRAKSVRYFDANDKEDEQPADLVVVAGFAVETPRLLLNSKSAVFPDGLANKNGQVGRYLNTRTAVWIQAVLGEPVHAYRGVGGVETHDFIDTHPQHDFVRGFTIGLTGINNTFLEDFANARGRLWGKELKEHMADFVYTIGGLATGECIPDENNRVVLDPGVKDRFGIPVARMIARYTDNDKKVRDLAIKKCYELLDAAGAKKTYILRSVSVGVHGSCRMGSDVGNSVVNAYSQTHEVANLFIADSSVMTTGGSGPVTMTTVALAIRTGEYIVRNFSEITKRGARA
ncbi:MAG: GMC family oxidoreductase [Acidobacteria bacterium]|nr:GMC family oxidoreductase [Acidobacteriota bacterium]